MLALIARSNFSHVACAILIFLQGELESSTMISHSYAAAGLRRDVQGPRYQSACGQDIEQGCSPYRVIRTYLKQGLTTAKPLKASSFHPSVLRSESNANTVFGTEAW